MEDILALFLIVAGVASVTLAIRFGYSKYKVYKIKQAEEAEAEQKRQIEATRKWRESRKQYVPSQWAPVTPPKKTETVRNYDTMTTTTRTRDTSSDDGFLTGMLAGMVIDSLTHKSGGSSPIDFPKTESSSSSSWGLDDDDSRKSISSSMSDSWSSSSSSDSWSSSDSGPSSDW